MPAPGGAPQTHLTGEGLKGRDAREFDRLNRPGSLSAAACSGQIGPPRITKELHCRSPAQDPGGTR